MQTPEGELLLIVKELEKNIGCAKTSDFKPNRGDEELPKLPKSKKQKHNKPKKINKYSEPGKMEGISVLDKPALACETKTCGACEACYARDNKGDVVDKTTEFLESKGIMVKYEQEPDVTNSVPTFMDHSGGTPVEAIGGYHTNQTLPHYQEKAPKSTFITEKAKIPSVSQTGYDEKGSSLHMHLNDQGGSGDYRATIEESMTQLKKAGGYNNPGLVEEIATQVEKLMNRLS